MVVPQEDGLHWNESPLSFLYTTILIEMRRKMIFSMFYAEWMIIIIIQPEFCPTLFRVITEICGTNFLFNIEEYGL